MIAKNSSYPRKKKTKYFGCSIAICLIVDKKEGGGGEVILQLYNNSLISSTKHY